jgi:hypothetical protein
MAEKNTGAVLAGAAAITSLATLAVTLSKPAQAAVGPGEYPPVQLVLDDVTRQTLAAIINSQIAIYEKLGRIDQGIQALIGLMGAQPEGRLILDPFEQNNQALQRGVPFPLYSKTQRTGALIWAVVDVSDPHTSFSIRFDELVWKFKFDDLQNEGVDAPLAPGVWLSKYDTTNKHFAMVFSAGTTRGFGFSKMCLVNITYEGATSAILNQGRGIAWMEP